MSDIMLLMGQKEIAERAGISQQMVSYITAKVGITSLNSHFRLQDGYYYMRGRLRKGKSVEYVIHIPKI